MTAELFSGEGVAVEKIDMIYDSVTRIENNLKSLGEVQASHSTRLAILEDRNRNGDPVGVLAQKAGWVTSLVGLGKLAAMILVGAFLLSKAF